MSKNLHAPIFRQKNFTHWKRVSRDYFASNKHRKYIIISNLALFLLKLNKMCKYFNSYEESLQLGVCKLAKYVRNCVVFWNNLHSWQKFYTTAGRGKFQVCLHNMHFCKCIVHNCKWALVGNTGWKHIVTTSPFEIKMV